MKTGIHYFVSLMVKIILLGLAFTLLAPASDKTQYFVRLSFNSTIQLIISSNLQKLLKYLNDPIIVTFSRISLA